MDHDILAYIGEQDAFIISLEDSDSELAPKLIGTKDKEKGYRDYRSVWKY